MIETLSEHGHFGGVQGFYRHASSEIGLPMRFAVYQPPQSRERPVPLLFCLAGLTCTEETFTIKAGAQRFAAEHGLMLVCPDTSPRQTGIEGESADWDFGVGAGFYLDATQAPWDRHFRMASYLVQELRPLVIERFAVDAERIGILGHSMGGHGALTLGLKHPDVFRSVSAFAPICAPSLVPWGEKAFSRYLGEDRQQWAAHDATSLMRERDRRIAGGILIDQGLDDQFISNQLLPEQFETVCKEVGQPLTLRRHAGYDHGYYFIATFIADHLAFHARQLNRA